MSDMFYLKSCRKCQGDVRLQRDSDGPYLQCLQCGQVTYLPAAGVLAKAEQVASATTEQVAV